MKKGLKLIDNSSREYQHGEVLRDLLKDTSYSSISIATGYWDLRGMVEIYGELEVFLNRDNTIFRLLLIQKWELSCSFSKFLRSTNDARDCLSKKEIFLVLIIVKFSG